MGKLRQWAPSFTHLSTPQHCLSTFFFSLDFLSVCFNSLNCTRSAQRCSMRVISTAFSAVLMMSLIHEDFFFLNSKSLLRAYIKCKHAHTYIHTPTYALHGVYFSLSLFVNSNGGAPKGRWRANKWRIFSLLNGALEGL